MFFKTNFCKSLDISGIMFKNGVYTVTITFNPETKAVDAVATKTADIVPEGIESVGADTKAGKTVKVLRNGQLLIQKDGRTYTAQGQLLK